MVGNPSPTQDTGDERYNKVCSALSAAVKIDPSDLAVVIVNALEKKYNPSPDSYRKIVVGIPDQAGGDCRGVCIFDDLNPEDMMGPRLPGETVETDQAKLGKAYHLLKSVAGQCHNMGAVGFVNSKCKRVLKVLQLKVNGGSKCHLLPL
jgi:hypothetical protein